jgi:hypothetical protein
LWHQRCRGGPITQTTVVCGTGMIRQTGRARAAKAKSQTVCQSTYTIARASEAVNSSTGCKQQLHNGDNGTTLTQPASPDCSSVLAALGTMPLCGPATNKQQCSNTTVEGTVAQLCTGSTSGRSGPSHALCTLQHCRPRLHCASAPSTPHAANVYGHGLETKHVVTHLSGVGLVIWWGARFTSCRHRACF